MTEFRTFGARFWAFLAGQSVSAIGSWASLVAIWGYAAYAFDAGATDIGLVGVAWLLPPVVLGPLAGTAVDRFGPRPVLVAAKALGAVASVALIGADTFGLLIAFSVGHGVAYAFSQPALDAFPPRLVGEDRLASANALVHVATDLSIVLGPIAAAGSIALWGFHGAFIVDAVSYLIGIAATLVVTLRPAPPLPDRRAGAWRETFDGLAVVIRTRPLRATIGLTGSVYFLYGTALILEPLYVRDVLDRPVSTFALLQSAFGVCLVLTGLVTARLGDRVASRAVVALAVIGSAVGAAWYLGTTSIVVAFAGVMTWGAVTAFVAGPSRTVLQRHAPEGTQGRVLAVDRTVEGVATLAAMPIAGFLAATVGVQGAAVLIAAGVLIMGARDRLVDRRRPGEAPVDADADAATEVAAPVTPALEPVGLE